MPKYEALSAEVTELIEKSKSTGVGTGVAFDNALVVRRRNLEKDCGTVWRPTFVHDIDKIMHCPFYNRYTDKTQAPAVRGNCRG